MVHTPASCTTTNDDNLHVETSAGTEFCGLFRTNSTGAQLWTVPSGSLFEDDDGGQFGNGFDSGDAAGRCW
jgi:hypothetical protein